MKDRIKQVRKALSKTQTQFGEIIGVKANTIANYEIGLRVPSDAVILSICREYGVNEVWLRTGEGEMFRPISRDEEIARFVGSALSGQPSDFRRHLLHALSILDESQWTILADIAEKLYAEQQAEEQAKEQM